MKKLKDPGSALTHGMALILAVIGTPVLLLHAEGSKECLSYTVFMVSMMLLYGASTLYHSLDLSEQGNKRLRKLDHVMIYILIAGTYTPTCLLGIGGNGGFWLMIVVWILALGGAVMNLCWIGCPKWFSAIIYIALGWSCIPMFSTILTTLSKEAFWWLLAGGVLYTAGGVIYALKLPLLNGRYKYFGIHELFHVFVMAGSVCHYMLMFYL